MVRYQINGTRLNEILRRSFGLSEAEAWEFFQIIKDEGAVERITDYSKNGGINIDVWFDDFGNVRHNLGVNSNAPGVRTHKLPKP